jgi:hypothetical protein
MMAKAFRITTLYQLRTLALNKRAVICPKLEPWKKPKPAAFVINLPGLVIERMISSGMFLHGELKF